MRRVAIILLLLIPGLANAGTADEAALAAQEVTEEHCAQGASGKAVQRSKALMEVSKVLGRVDVAYEQTQEPYLLYWRGIIYQCLGQYEDALADLEAFLAAAGEWSAYAEQLKAARSQLVRAGRKVASAALGPAARRIRTEHALEVSLRYGGGGALRNRTCTESVDPESITFQRCVGGGAEAPTVGGSVVPLDAAARIAGFALPAVGFGGGIGATWALLHHDVVDGKDVSLDLGETSPAVVGWIGPVFRATNRAESSRAVALRVTPRVAFGSQQVEAQAGHYDFASPSESSQQLSGGAWTALQFGGGLSVSLLAEINDRATFVFEGSGEGFMPATEATLLVARAPDPRVERPLQPFEANRVRARLAAGVVLLPTAEGQIALGPTIAADAEFNWLQVPDGLDNTWGRHPCADAPDDTCGAPHSKVFSTRRMGLAITGGLRVDASVR